MAVKKIRLRRRDIDEASLPSQADQIKAMSDRLDRVIEAINGIAVPEVDIAPVRSEVASLRGDLASLKTDLAGLREEVTAEPEPAEEQPIEWKFDIRRRAGRIVDVTAKAVGAEAKEGRKASMLNLYKET